MLNTESKLPYIFGILYFLSLLFHSYLKTIVDNCSNNEIVLESAIKNHGIASELVIPLDYLIRQILYYCFNAICDYANLINVILISLKIVIISPAIFVVAFLFLLIIQ